MEARHADQDRKTMFFGGTILVGICLLFVGLVGRLAYINTLLAPRLQEVLGGQRTGRTPLPARRGCILDARGRLVAGTRQRPSVFADPALIGDVEAVARRLAPVLDIPADRIAEKIRSNDGRRFCWLSRLLQPDDSDAVKALNIRGIGVRNESERSYPMGELMGPILGLVGRDHRGLEGLELVYDEHLRGADGKRASIYDGRKFKRTPIWWREELSKAEHDGGHVVLTIDSVIQRFAQSHLYAAVEAFEAESGVALVLAPRTGGVLAIAQSPTFDPNRYQDAPAARRRNRAICDVTEPGSTFKPYVACGALLAGVVDPHEKIFCHNGQHYFGRRLMHDTHPSGMLDFEGILTRSSNIGMGILGERMGNEVIHKMVWAFGFGRRLGVKFPGEAPGLVRPLEQWTRYSTTSVPIGQEIAVTPLQLISAFCAIVNGGNLMRPRLVQTLLDAKGTVVASFDQPEVIRRVLPRDLADYMATQVLVGVVKNGGARSCAPAGWQMAGKTGTAQIPFKDRAGYEPGVYTGSFMGAAPAHDPQCAVLVMIHRPNPAIGYYGSKVAAPAAGKIMADALAYLQVPPTEHSGRLAAVGEYVRDMGERAIRIGDEG